MNANGCAVEIRSSPIYYMAQLCYYSTSISQIDALSGHEVSTSLWLSLQDETAGRMCDGLKDAGGDDSGKQ